MPDRYSDKQVEEILVHAMNKPENDGFSRSQLEEMADELGISAEALAEAEAQIKTTSSISSVSLISPASNRQTRVATTPPTLPDKSNSEPALGRNGFSQHLLVYLLVNGGLLVLNFVFSGAITWALYSIFGWGIGLAFHPRRSPTHQSPE